MLAILLYNEYIIWNKGCEIMPEIFGIKYNEPEILPLEYIMQSDQMMIMLLTLSSVELSRNVQSENTQNLG